MKNSKIYLLAAILGFQLSANARTQQDQYLNQFMNLLDANPTAAMNELPPKFNSRGEKIQSSLKTFTTQEVLNGNFVLRKDEARRMLCPNAKPGQPCNATPEVFSRSGLSIFSAIENNNEIQEFFGDQQIEKSLSGLSKINSAKVSIDPWSGDYWATARGGIAFRYDDPNIPSTNKFQEYAYYVQSNTPNLDMSDEALRLLSPAEKYDLIVGDKRFGLTNWSINNSLSAMKADGTIESWFGICHGWAPASYMADRPVKAIEIAKRDAITNHEVRIRLYPDDIKALVSLAWANANYASRMIGGRCNDKNPKRDESGHLTSPVCFDVNPGTWHLAALNQIGINKQSMVIDATYDYEVWNQPVDGITVKYFNPLHRREYVSLEEAKLSLADYVNDPFKKYRNPEAIAVAGVVMNLTYITENSASSQDTDSVNFDNRTTVVYIYDLEINENGEIIGGEWYQNAHPDFIWTPPAGTKPMNREDYVLRGGWNDFSAPPAEWSSAAARASSQGHPLYKVIQHLIELAQ